MIHTVRFRKLQSLSVLFFVFEAVPSVPFCDFRKSALSVAVEKKPPRHSKFQFGFATSGSLTSIDLFITNVGFSKILNC